MNLLTKILHYQRVSFIALEKKRLEPDDLTPAQDIIIEDLKIEIEQQRAWHDLSGERLIGPLFWILFIVGVAILTIVILAFWP